ncbi:MAG: hypothetical protein QM820_29490 [Minicystis sp.]
MEGRMTSSEGTAWPCLLGGLSLVVAGCAATPPPSPAGPDGASVRADVASFSTQDAGAKADARTACEALVDPRMVSLFRGRPLVEDSFPKVFELIATARRCAARGLLISDAILPFATVGRDAMIAWYGRDPAAHSASIFGDPQATRLSGELDASAPARAAWADHYLWARGALAAVGGTSSAPTLGERMLTVDALASALSHRLGMPPDPPGTADRVRDLARDFETALQAEAEAWRALPSAQPALSKATWIDPERTPTPAGWSVGRRVTRVSEMVHALAEGFASHEPDEQRALLGKPYRAYIATLEDGEHGTPPDARLKVPWVARAGAPHGEELDAELPLARILEEIQYDGFHLRALFSARDAEAAWLAILPPTFDATVVRGTSEEASEQRVRDAGAALVAAATQTEDTELRLHMLGTLVERVGLVVVQPREEKPGAGMDSRATPHPAREAVRRAFAVPDEPILPRPGRRPGVRLPRPQRRRGAGRP